jgi:hypothetical protein
MRGRKKRSKRAAPKEPYVLVPAGLLTHQEWVQLDPAARVIFIDVCTRHNGRNNGAIGYGCAAGAKAANVSPSTANRRLNQLRKSGLLKLRKGGIFNIKDCEKQSREWEITIFAVAGRSPSINWLFGERKIKVEHWWLECDRYIALPNAAKCTLLELMRRFDGNNNGAISFGGKDGGHIGLSRDLTERAPTAPAAGGFIVETAPADPRNGVSRKWRLTMYKAGSERATKDFMRPPTHASEKSIHGVTGADDKALNVSMMRMPISPRLPVPMSASDEAYSVPDRLRENPPVSDIRASDTFAASDIRAGDMHIETIPLCEGDGLDLLPISPGSATADLAKLKTVEVPLFGDDLNAVPTQLELLRLDLRRVLSLTPRGTQSRIAAGLGLARATFSNALAGRVSFAPTTVAVLRQWVNSAEADPVSPPTIGECLRTAHDAA